MPSSRSALCIRAVCSKQSPRSHLSVCGKCFCASLLMLQENSCSTEKRYTFSLCLFRFDSMPTFYFLLSESELLCSSCLCLKYSLSLNMLSISKLKVFSTFFFKSCTQRIFYFHRRQTQSTVQATSGERGHLECRLIAECILQHSLAKARHIKKDAENFRHSASI